MKLKFLLATAVLIGFGCGGSGNDRDCQGDLNEIRADACYPQLVELAIANDVSEQSFLNTCNSVSDSVYSTTRSCIASALERGQCNAAFRLYWYGADSNCNPAGF